MTGSTQDSWSRFVWKHTSPSLQIDWKALCAYASDVRNGQKCSLTDPTTMGGVHFIRILQFDDGTFWIARIQMEKSTPSSIIAMRSEVATMELVRKRTSIPVPEVFACEPDDKNALGIAFMLMECLPGNAAIDLDGGYHMHLGEIPDRRNKGFFEDVARVQVEMATVRFPKIGCIIRRGDGTYDVGPIPDIGGPFETATAFYESWSANAKFPYSEKTIRKMMSSHSNLVDTILSSIANFPSQVNALANRLSSYDCGPFPLMHTDLFHSNIVVDHGYKILGIIDWEGAFTAPWELVMFPLFLRTIPRPMDLPSNYDERGNPTDPTTRRLWREREDNINTVRGIEMSTGKDTMLSEILGNSVAQDLATAIKEFLVSGKLGFYLEVLKPFSGQSSEFDQSNGTSRSCQLHTGAKQ